MRKVRSYVGSGPVLVEGRGSASIGTAVEAPIIILNPGGGDGALGCPGAPARLSGAFCCAGDGCGRGPARRAVCSLRLSAELDEELAGDDERREPERELA